MRGGTPKQRQALISRICQRDHLSRSTALTNPQKQPGNHDKGDDDTSDDMFPMSHSHVLPHDIFGIGSERRSTFGMFWEMDNL
jgi:hypothetical protein